MLILRNSRNFRVRVKEFSKFQDGVQNNKKQRLMKNKIWQIFIKGVHGDLRNQVQKGTEAFLYCLILKHVTGNSINDAISYGYLVVFSKLAMIFNPVP